MPISAEDIKPASDTSDTPESSIPDEVLQIPAFAALLQGKPPAIFSPKGDTSPEVTVIERNTKPLLAAGFGFYRPKDDSGSVLFNTRFISPEEVKLADQKGQLDTIAPPASELLEAFKSVAAPDEAAATAAPSTTPVPPPAATPATVTNARLKNVTVGSPTSGPTPGAGRLLNNVLKTTV